MCERMLFYHMSDIMFREMRRFKQLLPQETAVEILNRSISGTFALRGDDDSPYAVPMSYIYSDGKLYFHSAKSGQSSTALKTTIFKMNKYLTCRKTNRSRIKIWERFICSAFFVIENIDGYHQIYSLD